MHITERKQLLAAIRLP